jgi:hypothetical protein
LQIVTSELRRAIFDQASKTWLTDVLRAAATAAITSRALTSMRVEMFSWAASSSAMGTSIEDPNGDKSRQSPGTHRHPASPPKAEAPPPRDNK